MNKRTFSIITDIPLEQHDFELIHRHILKICKFKYNTLEINSNKDTNKENIY